MKDNKKGPSLRPALRSTLSPDTLGRGSGLPDIAVPNPTGFPTTGEELRVWANNKTAFYNFRQAQ